MRGVVTCRSSVFLLQLTVCAAVLAGCGQSKCDPGCSRERTEAGDGGSSRKDAGPMVDLDEPLPDAGVLPYACEAGVMDGVTKRYAALEPGGVIPIGGTGQAGLVARLALRCTPLADAPPLEMARVDLLLVNPFTGITAPRKSRPRNHDLFCDSDGVCELVPILVEISHLTDEVEALEGLPVRVDVRVQAIAGDEALLGHARSHGLFQRQ